MWKRGFYILLLITILFFINLWSVSAKHGTSCWAISSDSKSCTYGAWQDCKGFWWFEFGCKCKGSFESCGTILGGETCQGQALVEHNGCDFNGCMLSTVQDCANQCCPPTQTCQGFPPTCQPEQRVCVPNQGQSCNKNECGVYGGVIQCDGTCSGTTPSLPEGYGGKCNYNVCGQYGGTIKCDGSCSGTIPSLPEGYGSKCNYNVCGQYGGTKQCDGSCSGAAPSLPDNYGQPCGVNGKIQCDGACSSSITSCDGKTPLNTCSSNKPQFCDSNANLVNDCNKCGCPISGQTCQADGSCSIPPQVPTPKCGDGNIDKNLGEVCDSSNIPAGQTCVSQGKGFTSGTLKCSSDCKSFDTRGCVKAQTCPTCPSPSAWDTCLNNKQTRTNYKCDAATNFQCRSFIETEVCTEAKPVPVGSCPDDYDEDGEDCDVEWIQPWSGCRFLDSPPPSCKAAVKCESETNCRECQYCLPKCRTECAAQGKNVLFCNEDGCQCADTEFCSPFPSCKIDSASITPNCGDSCEPGETVVMSASGDFTACFGGDLYFQIDAKSADNKCRIASGVQYGFNTHMYTEGSTNLDLVAFKNNVDDMVSREFNWFRFSIPTWEALTLSGTTIAWKENNLIKFDEAIDYAKGKGLKIFLVTAPPYHAALTQTQYEKVVSDYYDFLAKRYKDKVDIWQIYNEANIHKYTDYSPIFGIAGFPLPTEESSTDSTTVALWHMNDPSELSVDSSTKLLVHMNELSGIDVADATGLHRIATFGTPDITTGRFGNARNFDDGTITATGSDLDFSSAITVEAWVSPAKTGLNNAGIVSRQKRTSDFPGIGRYLDEYTYALNMWGGKACFSVWINGVEKAACGNTVLDLNWHHVAGAYDGSAVKIYVDGNLDGSFAATGKIDASSSAVLWIGKRNVWGANFDGTIDEVRVSGTARTEKEIAKAGGKLIHDSSGKHDGTINKAVRTAGKFGDAFSFNGVDSYIEVPDFPSTSPFTISAWIKTSDTSQTKQIVTKNWDDSKIPFMLELFQGKPTIVLNRGSGISVPEVALVSPQAVKAGQWTHIQATHDGSFVQLFVNGERVAFAEYKETIQQSNDPVLIGKKNQWGGNFDGIIDEVRISVEAPPLPHLDSQYLTNLNNLISIARQKIKAVDSDALITTNAGGWPYTNTLHNQWKQFFNAIHTNLDVISIDTYPDKFNTVINALGSRTKELKSTYGKPVFVSETGMCTNVFSEVDQGEFVTKYIRELKKALPDAIIVYEIQDDTSSFITNACERSFGLKKSDGTPKSSHSAVLTELTKTASPSMSGITHRNPVFNAGKTQVTGIWTVRDVPVQCLGKTVDAWKVALWDEEPGIGRPIIDKTDATPTDSSPVAGSITWVSDKCKVNPGQQEICNNGIDDNCNGKTDCTDPGCANKQGPTSDQWVGGGNTQTAVCGSADNDASSEYRDYHCTGTSAGETYTVTQTKNCNSLDGWYGGGNNAGCGTDPNSIWNDYYVVANTNTCTLTTSCSGANSFNCDSQDICTNRCEGTVFVSVPPMKDYYVATNTNTCTSTTDSPVKEDCAAKASADSDGSSTAYTTAGTVTDYMSCTLNGCTSTSHNDACSGTVLTEYGASGSSIASSQFDCQSYEAFYCSNDRHFRQEWGCSSSPGYCNDAAAADTQAGTNADNDAKDKECGDSLCDNAAGVYDSTKKPNEAGFCSDNLDNDCDGKFDANQGANSDPDCCSFTQSTETICDGKDNNCNGIIDENCDKDNDNYCDAAMSIQGTPATCTSGGNDCNDNNANVNPGQQEICTNNIDDNCNAKTDCQEASCAGSISGNVKDTNNEPVDNAKINVLQAANTKYTAYTQPQGDYQINSVLCGNYNMIASHSDYVSLTKENVNLAPKESIAVDFTGQDALVLGTLCEDDCTYTGDNLIHKECDGKNGCAFFDGIAAQACNLAQPGWLRDYNDLASCPDGCLINNECKKCEVECAENAPIEKIRIKATVACDEENLLKTTKLVMYKGKLVKLHIVVCG